MESFDYSNEDLDNLIIKNKEYYKKRNKKIILISIPILLAIIAIVFIVIIFTRPKEDNKIICHYKINKDDENVDLININDNLDFNVIIDDKNYNKIISHKFEKAGTYNIIFEFETELDSLEGFFEGKKNLIDADFSKLKTGNIKSMANFFKDCSNLNKIFLIMKHQI